MEKNKITDKDFLSGADEAQAFESKEYHKLHQSTLRKVDTIANILERVLNGSLKHNAKFRDIYGTNIEAGMILIKEHPIFAIIGLLGSIASIIGIVSTIAYAF